MRSSWICSVAGRACAVVLLLLPAAALAAKGKSAKAPDYSPEEVTNFLLPPEYSLWLVGPISWMASKAEIDTYLGLDEAAAAQRFIDEFWKARRTASDAPWPDDQPAAVFTRRAIEADRRFSERARLGRHSDRGTIFILYGEPEEIGYEAPQRRDRPAVEVWEYAKEAETGLDGRQPKRKYFFRERNGRTEFSGPLPPPSRRPIG